MAGGTFPYANAQEHAKIAARMCVNQRNSLNESKNIFQMVLAKNSCVAMVKREGWPILRQLLELLCLKQEQT